MYLKRYTRHFVYDSIYHEKCTKVVNGTQYAVYPDYEYIITYIYKVI